MLYPDSDSSSSRLCKSLLFFKLKDIHVVGHMKKISVVTIVGILFLFTLAGVGNLTAAQAVDNTFTDTLAPDLPIDIDEDSDFVSYGFPGNGSAVNPYIIKDRSFEVEEGYWMCGIKIQFTTVHFVIEKCNFTAAAVKTEEPTYSDFGVYMKEVTNGVVRDCIFSELMYGVFVVNSEDITVENNNFTGMNLNWAEFENMGRGVGTGSIESINQRIVIRNNYMENCSQGILLMEAEEFDVYGNTIVTSGTGIHAEHEVTDGTIRENTILNGTHAGIQCTRLNGIAVLNNTCMYNKLYGIWIDEDGDNVNVTLNVVEGNGDFVGETGAGIYVSNLSSGSNVSMNDLISNFQNVYNDKYGAFYDLNYYSDYT